MSRAFDIAVLGATGAVGEVLLELLAEREFVGKVYPLASSRSLGETVRFKGASLDVQDAEQFDWSQVQLAFFSAGAETSQQYAPLAADAGVVVIDNTSAFRYEPDVPLVVPEVNPHALADYRNRGIVANPNCSTIQMLVALKPIQDAVGISRINVATYQSVSGTGKQGINELAKQTADLLNARGATSEVYPHQIAFNVLPQIDEFMDNGYTKEEMKLVWETQKIFADDSIMVNPTTVRVPVFYGHAEAVHLEALQPIGAEQAKELLRDAPGVELLEDDADYPTPITHASGNDAVFVGRVREDISHPSGLNMWVVSDNIRKGAALNAVQIAERLIEDYL